MVRTHEMVSTVYHDQSLDGILYTNGGRGYWNPYPVPGANSHQDSRIIHRHEFILVGFARASWLAQVHFIRINDSNWLQFYPSD